MAAHKFHLQQQFVGHGGAAICSGILLGDNKTVVTSGYDRTLQLWKLSADGRLEQARTIAGLPYFVKSALAVLPPGIIAEAAEGGFVIATHSSSKVFHKHVFFYNLAGDMVRELEASSHVKGIQSLGWTADPHPSLIVGGIGGVVTVHSMAAGKFGTVLSTMPEHEGACNVLGLPERTVAVGSSGTQMVGPNRTNACLRLWRCAEAGAASTLSRHQDHEQNVRVLVRDHNVGFLTGSNDGTIKLRTLDGSVLSSMQLPTNWENNRPMVIAVARGTNFIASGSDDKCMRYWKSTGGHDDYPHPNDVTAVVALPGDSLLSGCADGYLRVWTPDIAKANATDTMLMDTQLAEARKVLEKLIRKQREQMGQKVTVEGIQYDRQLDIVLDDVPGSEPLPLGFNYNEDAGAAAERFCRRHGLGREQKQQIQNTISAVQQQQNPGGHTTTTSPPAPAPSGMPLVGSPFFAPAAAPSAAVAINPAQQQRQKFASVLGTTAFSYREKAGSGAFGGISKKITQFNGEADLPPHLKLSDAELRAVTNALKTLSDVASYDQSSFPRRLFQCLASKLVNWPGNKVWVVLDFVRLLLLHPVANRFLMDEDKARSAAAKDPHHEAGSSTSCLRAILGFVFPGKVRTPVAERLALKAATNLFQHQAMRLYLGSLWFSAAGLRADCFVGRSGADSTSGMAYGAALCFRTSAKMQLPAATVLFNLCFCLHEISHEHTESSPESLRSLAFVLSAVLKDAQPGTKPTGRLLQALALLLGTVSIRLRAGSLVDGEISGATRSLGRVVSSRYVSAVQQLSPSNPQASDFLKDCVTQASAKKA